jgi:hypothetical protein
MRKLLFSFLLMAAFGSQVWAQAARLESPDNFATDKACTFLIDLKACTYGGAAELIKKLDAGETLYLWTWNPGGSVANGEWSASNPDMAVTNKGNGVVSFTVVPTTFYKVDAKTVFDKDFSMLVKGKDGSEKIGGFEMKTEDLKIEVAPPSFKLFNIPPAKSSTNDSTFSSASEWFTFFYDSKLEAKSSMQGATEFAVFSKGYLDDGSNVTVVNFRTSGTDPRFQMSPVTGNQGVFMWQIIPNELFKDKLAGKKLVKIDMRVIKKGATGTGDAIDETVSASFSDCP